MEGSVYKIIEVIGTSQVSWEQAAEIALMQAARSLRDIRVAEVVSQDMHIEDNQTLTFRTRLKISFKYHDDDEAH